MTKAAYGTRKYRPATAYKVKLTKRNVKQMLSRNANVIATRFGLALKRLAPMVSKVENLVQYEGDILSDLQADLTIYLGKIRDACEKALEKHKEDLVMNNNNMTGNRNNTLNANVAKLARQLESENKKKKADAGVNDLLAGFGSLTF